MPGQYGTLYITCVKPDWDHACRWYRIGPFSSSPSSCRVWFPERAWSGSSDGARDALFTDGSDGISHSTWLSDGHLQDLYRIAVQPMLLWSPCAWQLPSDALTTESTCSAERTSTDTVTSRPAALYPITGLLQSTPSCLNRSATGWKPLP